MEVVFSWLHEYYKHLYGMSVKSIEIDTNEDSDYEVQNFLEKVGKQSSTSACLRRQHIFIKFFVA